MESNATKYSAAAVLALAVTLVLLAPFGTSRHGAVVLADVQENVNRIETLIIRGTKTFTLPGEDATIFEFNGIKAHFDVVKYFSVKYGLIEEGYAAEELIYRFTFNRPQRQTLLLLPRYRKYGKFPSTDAQMRLLENGTPQGIINLLTQGSYQELGPDTVDGVEAEIFAFQDPEPFVGLLPKAIFDIRGLTGKVWIGIAEQLPVRVEGDLDIGRSFMTLFHELNLHEVNTFGDYNIDLDEAIFDTTPPQGYEELTLSDMLRLVPPEARVGLAGLAIVPAGVAPWCLFFVRRSRRRARTRRARRL